MALGYARLGQARVANARLGAFQPLVKVLINGVDRTANVRIEGAHIEHNLDGTPSTAALRISGLTMTVGTQVQMYLGAQDAAHTLFAGHAIQVKTLYEDVPTRVAYDCSLIDYTWTLNSRKVTRFYQGQSATAIVSDLVALYTSGITTAHVVPDLPVIDEITFSAVDLTDALNAIAARIGGYWYLDFAKDLHVFLSEALTANSLTDAVVPHGTDGLAAAVDLSSVKTRVWVRGGGASVTSEVLAGSTTLPLSDDREWFSASGGTIDLGSQRITYTGRAGNGGFGSETAGVSGVVLPPAPTLLQRLSGIFSQFVAGSLGIGTYAYAVTYVNSLGETAAGPVAQVVTQPVANPSSFPGATPTTGGALTPNTTYTYGLTYVTAAGETTALTFPRTLAAGQNAVSFTSIPIAPDGRVTGRRLYRTAATGGSGLKLVATIANNTATTYTDVTADGSLGAAAPATNTAGTAQVDVSFTLGPAGTTARKLYRSTLNSSTLKLLATIGDNTTTTYTDNTADGSLGAVLSGASIAASPGDTQLSVVSLTQFASSGWVRVGSQVIKYSGTTGTPGTAMFLTGIPSSGPGSIKAVIKPGTEVVVEPYLRGIPSSGAGALLYDVAVGTTATVVVMVEDAAAQAALAAALGSGDGVREDTISAGSASVAECLSRGQAELQRFKDPITTITFRTRDVTTVPGRSITITRTNPPVSGTFKIQRVTLSEIAVGGGTNTVLPLRSVEASSVRFSLENLLRQWRGRNGD